MSGLSAIGALAIAVCPVAAGLTATEARLAAMIAGREPAATALLREAVEIDSGTLELDGVRQVGALFRRELDALGFATRWIDGAPFDRAGHLVAHRPGGRPHVVLIGHLDTVFGPETGFSGWTPLDGRRVRGPGIIDMKGGNVVMLEALRGLAAVDRLDRLELSVILTGDEERPGALLALSRRELVEIAQRADVAIGLEDGDGRPDTAVIARRGFESWRLEVEAQSAHSSQIFSPEVGDGAVYELARVLDGIRRGLAGEPLLTINPALAIAGSAAAIGDDASGTASGKDNVVASRAVATGDLRSLSAGQRSKAHETMLSIAAASLPGTSSRLVFAEGYPPMADSPGNRALLARYDAVSRALGLGPVTAVDPADAGAADVSFAAPHVAMALDGLGLMGTGGHTVEETADLSTLVTQAQRLALLLLRLGEETWPPPPSER